MSVKTDLATSVAQPRCLFLEIDGYEPLLFQRSRLGTPTGWSRSISVCLDPPVEDSTSLSVTEAISELSSMTFELTELKTNRQPDLGPVLAPASWLADSAVHSRLSKASSTWWETVGGNSTAIPVDYPEAFTNAAGTVYIGRTTASYTATNGTHLTGATMGRYPAGAAVNANLSDTFERAVNGDSMAGVRLAVSTKPFSFVGRRVALKVITWNRATGAWQAESDAEVLWYGQVSDSVVRDPATGKWKLTAVSIVEALAKNDIPSQFPQSDMFGISLGLSHTFTVGCHNDTNTVVLTVTIPAGFYQSALSLGNAAASAITAAVVAKAGSLAGHPEPYIEWYAPSNRWAFSIKGIDGADTSVTINFSTGRFNHALHALGFPGTGSVSVSVPDNTAKSYLFDYHVASDAPAHKYHPCNLTENGGRLGCLEPERLWADQGDATYARGCVVIEEAIMDAAGNKTGRYVTRYTDRSAANHWLVLDTAEVQPYHADARVVQRFGDAEQAVKQCYVPSSGPFESLLYPLMSTGTRGHNGAYDTCPWPLALGVPAARVDVGSFKLADKSIAFSGLADRGQYVIDEGTSWVELVRRECQLFGYALVHAEGRLAVENVMSPDPSLVTVTLNESTWKESHLCPAEEQDLVPIVNSWEFNLKADFIQGTDLPAIEINDSDSVKAFGTLQSSIDHPGINAWNSTVSQVTSWLTSMVLSRTRFRTPLTRVQVSYQPHVLRKLYAGRMVRFVDGRMLDPRNGTVGVNGYATITSVTREYDSWTGTATLLVHSIPPKKPWAPCAILQPAGYDGAATLTLDAHVFSSSPSPHDGDALLPSGVSSGTAYYYAIDRCPSDRTAAQKIPFSCDLSTAVYYQANQAFGPVNGLAGWDTTKEYVVCYADYSECSAAQLTDSNGDPTAAFQADSASEQLSGPTTPDRY